jgi:hypothetical protein
MKRMTTKMSTVTPVTKSTGSGVANMGKGKNKGKAPKEGFFNKAYKEASNEGMQDFTKVKMSLAEKRADKKAMEKAMAIGAAAGASMPRFAMERTVTKKTTKAKAKMLPEVKVTAPGKFKRFVSKITSKRK